MTVRQLTGRTALITGASRGLGVYIARALADEGMNLVLAARTLDNLETLAGELTQGGVEALPVATDVTDQKALESLVAAADARFGGIDVLVNNAGTLVLFPFHKLGIADMERALRLNLTSAMILTRLILPGMLTRGRGHVVNMSSLAGKWGPPFDQVYGVTKAGLIGFTESLRAEYRGTGVSASVICPGYVEEAGMYAVGRETMNAVAPAWVGRTRPRRVARAVVKAIKKDRPEIIVNTPPARLATVVTAMSPSLGHWAFRRFGGWAPFVRGAQVNLQTRGQVTGLTGSPSD
jgi:short-subunit dehydrogenase